MLYISVPLGKLVRPDHVREPGARGEVGGGEGQREGVSLSYVPFVIKAAGEALKQYPSFNAHWTDGSGAFFGRPPCLGRSPYGLQC